ncbi:serine hydrolase domain-containing protein [Segeticoccus rhizosphaerae]|uniref:serine hydrolase domain-containing protein n=1 Tax=Segeticoccus rhizosphaerae TaxID=1104777 RepID=UPI0010C11B1B|nr:serine hydrolase domain-containing protein [Ornithinicoccus soli]
MSGLGEATRSTLDRLAANAQRDWRTPGLSAGLVRDGELVWSSHVGSARLEPEPEPATDDTQYLIGSVTKTFTAVLVMALRDEGKLRLDDPLSTHLPGTAHGTITIRQMLAHASGLQREPVGRIWESLDAPDEERLLRELGQAERVLPPHFAFHYSNLAYALLGQVVERLEGCSWQESVTRRVLQPLGMAHSGLTPDDARRAHGYSVHPHSRVARREPLFELRATAPLGGLWSTVADLARYAAFVADPDPDVLSRDTVDEMCRPLIMTDLEGWSRAYGLGYDLQRAGDRVLAGHGGAMPGYVTGLRVRRKDKVGAVVFANTTAGADPVALATDLVTAVLDAEPTPATPWTPSRPQPALDGILGSWWSEGEEIVLEVRDGQLWSRLPALPGPLAETRFEADGTGRFRAVEGRERGELLEVTRDEQGAVSRLHFATYALTRAPASFGELAD